MTRSVLVPGTILARGGADPFEVFAVERHDGGSNNRRTIQFWNESVGWLGNVGGRGFTQAACETQSTELEGRVLAGKSRRSGETA